MPKKFSKPHLSRIINGDIVEREEQNDDSRLRLDHILVERFPSYNRSVLQKFAKSGLIKVNGEIVTKSNTLVEPDSEITLDVPKPSEPPKVPIIYEDNNVVVFNKPAGVLSTSKGEDSFESTVEDLLPEPNLLAHRLDRSTSGVIIGAKDRETRAYLQRQFQERKVHKTYYAIVVGKPKLPQAVIDLPIARNLKKPTTFIVDAAGRHATTEYKVIRTHNDLSLLELKPQTGRTHQLRVHLAYIGTPILGDIVYGGNRDKSQRIMLHAHSLEITIPSENGGIRKTFTVPLPEDFDHVLG